jgi:hypothetical protein
MILKNREFNHSKDHFHDAMNIPSYTRTRCRERIFFAAFSNALQRQELFEDEDDAPKEMSTVTGDLQRTLSMITDELEYEYTLLTFYGHQKLAMEAFGRYKYLNSKDQSKEDKLKLSIINLIQELKDRDDDDDSKEEEDELDNVTVNTVIKRISIVKDSHYNFETYLKQLTQKLSSRPDSDFNVDDFLKNIFD